MSRFGLMQMSLRVHLTMCFTESSFIPLEDILNRAQNEKIRIYHIGDTHSRIEQPLKSARAVGDFDLLILNGDIAENAGTEYGRGRYYFPAVPGE